jgi:methionyl aminopeptidase
MIGPLSLHFLSMSRKKTTKTTEISEEDEYAFLMAAAAGNKFKSETARTQERTSVQGSVTDPFANLPRRPSESFPDHSYPEVERQEYTGHRSTSAQLKELERVQYMTTVVPDLREGAEVHRRVRHSAIPHQSKRGAHLTQMCRHIEEAVRRLTGYQPITRGLAFPCGCSLNNCAAHWSPNRDDGQVLKSDDVMKIDFGVNINGHIVDSAFTVCFDEKFAPLLQSARDATNTGVKLAGIDVHLSDLGVAIQEVFDAASYEINGKVFDIKPISNLGGHLMRPYTIHAGNKRIPCVRGGAADLMEEGELYACETFGTTGKGRVMDISDSVSHYMVSPNPAKPRTPQQRKLLKTLQDNFSTLAFAPRFIDYIGEKGYQMNLRRLVEVGAVNDYPALSDVKGSHVAQFEHTFILLPTHKEILSRGDDY